MEKEDYDSSEDDLEERLESLLTSPTFPWEHSDSDSDAENEFPDEDEPLPMFKEARSVNKNATKTFSRQSSPLDDFEKAGREVDNILQSLVLHYQSELEYWETGQMAKTFQTLQQFINETPEPFFSPVDSVSRTVAVEAEKPIASAFLLNMKGGKAMVPFLEKNLRRLMRRYSSGKKNSIAISKELHQERVRTEKSLWAIVAGTEETKAVWTHLVSLASAVTPDGCILTIDKEGYLLHLLWVPLDEGLNNAPNGDSFRSQLHRIQCAPEVTSIFVFYEAPKYFRPSNNDGHSVRSRDAIIRDRIVVLLERCNESSSVFTYWRHNGLSAGFGHLLDPGARPLAGNAVAAAPAAPPALARRTDFPSVGLFIIGEHQQLDENVLLHALLESDPTGPRAAHCTALFGRPFQGQGPLEWTLRLFKHLISFHHPAPDDLTINQFPVDMTVAEFVATGTVLTRMSAILRDTVLDAALSRVGL